MELQISDQAFRAIRQLVYQETGISLKEHKRSMVVARLAKRLRALGLDGFDQYVEIVCNDNPALNEKTNLINCITTNKTDFFRELHHFEYLAKILPSLREQGEEQGRQSLRVWSSASSTGEEPYSIAMVLHHYFRDFPDWDVRVLASDIDTDVLAKASAGFYQEESLRPIPPVLRAHYFTRSRGYPEGYRKISEVIRKMVLFRKVNLIKDIFRFREPVDIIFCRNVVIYFDEEGKQDLVRKFHEVLRPGGLIFIGHSESLLLAKGEFRYLQNTVYQRD